MDFNRSDCVLFADFEQNLTLLMNIYNLKRNKHFIARLKKINKKKKNIFPYCAEWAHKTGAGSDAPRK